MPELDDANAFVLLLTTFAADIRRLLDEVARPDCPPPVQRAARAVAEGAETMLRRLIESA